MPWWVWTNEWMNEFFGMTKSMFLNDWVNEWVNELMNEWMNGGLLWIYSWAGASSRVVTLNRMPSSDLTGHSASIGLHFSQAPTSASSAMSRASPTTVNDSTPATAASVEDYSRLGFCLYHGIVDTSTCSLPTVYSGLHCLRVCCTGICNLQHIWTFNSQGSNIPKVYCEMCEFW